jgi:spermidine synthase
MQYWFAAFMLFSGFAGLVYQVTWIRLLGQSLGATSVSIGIVLAAFFLGLALGSSRAHRLGPARSSLGSYALLELLTGLSALALLPALLNLDQLLAFAPVFGAALLPKAVLCIVLLVPPTFCMGATFPVAAALLEARDGERGSQISRLYSCNTLGAVLGAGLSGLAIIPALGLDGATYLAAAVNIAIAAAATALLRSKPGAEQPMAPAESRTGPPSPVRVPALVTLALTGLLAIATQVGWTKFLVIAIGGTVGGLSIILAVFLSGIALGAWLMGRGIGTLKRPALSAAALLALLPFALLACRAALRLFPQLQALLNRSDADPATALILQAALMAAAVLPATLLLGAIFPLSLRLSCSAAAASRKDIGAAYAVNTLAGIAGALIGGLLIIPLWGTDVLLVAMAGLAALAASVWLPWLASPWQRAAIAAPVLAALLLIALLPGIDYRGMIAAAGYDYRSRAGEVPTFSFLKEGKAGVISLVSYDGKQMVLQTNGLNEASFTPGDPGSAPLVETLLGLLPYILHTDPQSALVIGLGAGNTAAALADTDLARIRIVELEPAVAEAGRAVSHGPAAVLDDPRVSIVFNDARNMLAVDDATYDLIVSQPSHPWVAGTAGVFTQEFWEIARTRLEDGGIFAQWLNLFRMNGTTLRAILKSFFTAFPEGFVLASDDSLILIGSAGPVVFDAARADALLRQPAIAARLARPGVHDWGDVLRRYVLSRDEALRLAGSTPGNLDRNILSETELALLFRDPSGDDRPDALIRAAGRMDPRPYLAEAADASLSDFIGMLIRTGEFDKAQRAVATLSDEDPAAVRPLAHGLALARGDYATAFALFDRHGDWSDAALAAQARAFADVGRMDRAWQAADAIAAPDRRGATLARLGYLDPAHARVPGDPAAVDVRLWQTLAAAGRADGSGPDQAGLAALARQMAPEDGYFLAQAQLREAMRRGDQRDIVRQGRALAEAAHARAARLVTVGQFADEAHDLPLLGEVLAQIYRLDETVEGYEPLRRKYAKLVP